MSAQVDRATAQRFKSLTVTVNRANLDVDFGSNFKKILIINESVKILMLKAHGMKNN